MACSGEGEGEGLRMRLRVRVARNVPAARSGYARRSTPPTASSRARGSQCAGTVSAARAMGCDHLGACNRVHTWRGVLRRRLLRLLVQRVDLELLGVGEQVRRQLARIHGRVLEAGQRLCIRHGLDRGANLVTDIRDMVCMRHCIRHSHIITLANI